MSFLGKLVFSAIVLLGFSVAAQSAGAQTITPTLVNSSNYDVTISDISWGGSYFPRIEGTYPANSPPVSGAHRFGNPRYTTYTYLDFKVSYTTDRGEKRTCLFWYNFDSDTQNLNSYGSSRIEGDPVFRCPVYKSSNNLNFTFEIQ